MDPREAQLAKATRCQLSGEVLSAPIAADELGHLFNKAAVVSAMVARTLPPALAHISRCVSISSLDWCNIQEMLEHVDYVPLLIMV